MESPKLGVIVKEKDQELVVVGVSPKSPAKKAWLQKGDIILQFAGHPIKSIGDLKLALFYSEMGNRPKIQIKRDEKTLDKKIEIFSFTKFSYFRKEHLNEP